VAVNEVMTGERVKASDWADPGYFLKQSRTVIAAPAQQMVVRRADKDLADAQRTRPLPVVHRHRDRGLHTSSTSFT
jgi:hypothetical protein